MPVVEAARKGLSRMGEKESMFMSRKFSILILTVGGFAAGAFAAPVQECPLDARMKGSGTSSRRPSILDAWKLKYPTSTLPDRMQAQAGWDCNTCHDPAGLGLEGNCYRKDFVELIQGGSTVEEALDTLDGMDSDGDGWTNGVEATMQRTDSADIGYNMGLVGDTGTNPCGTTPTTPITGVSETPPDPVPTVSQWGLVIMSLLVLAAGASILVRRPHCTA